MKTFLTLEIPDGLRQHAIQIYEIVVFYNKNNSRNKEVNIILTFEIYR